MYKLGDKFKLDEDLYIICSVVQRKTPGDIVSLINMETGNCYFDGYNRTGYMGSYLNITDEIFLKITSGTPEDFKPIKVTVRR